MLDSGEPTSGELVAAVAHKVLQCETVETWWHPVFSEHPGREVILSAFSENGILKRFFLQPGTADRTP